MFRGDKRPAVVCKAFTKRQDAKPIGRRKPLETYVRGKHGATVPWLEMLGEKSTARVGSLALLFFLFLFWFRIVRLFRFVVDRRLRRRRNSCRRFR